MRSTPQSRKSVIQNLARQRLRTASVVAVLSFLSACLAPPLPWVPGDGQLLPPLDSGALAYETGRRDARFQRQRTAGGAVSLIGPIVGTLGLIGRRRGTNYWVTPASVVAVGTGGALWDYRETGQPIPPPPDSMRSRYGLTDSRLWLSYGDGFREGIETRRRAELARSSRSALMTAILFGGTYAVLRRR